MRLWDFSTWRPRNVNRLCCDFCGCLTCVKCGFAHAWCLIVVILSFLCLKPFASLCYFLVFLWCLLHHWFCVSVVSFSYKKCCSCSVCLWRALVFIVCDPSIWSCLSSSGSFLIYFFLAWCSLCFLSLLFLLVIILNLFQFVWHLCCGFVSSCHLLFLYMKNKLWLWVRIVDGVALYLRCSWLFAMVLFVFIIVLVILHFFSYTWFMF